MPYLNTILSQLLVHVPRHDFQSLVSQHKADRYVKRFTTWNQLVTLLYAQAGDKKSLRYIQNGLTAYRRTHERKAFFVTRAKINLQAYVIGQQELPKNKAVLADQTIELVGVEKFPYPLRLIRYYDAENERTFEFLTNHFGLPAATIAAIYKARWQIEAFFKWIKQNLKIKTFLGTSKNAVMAQVWVALCYYLLLAYIKFQTKYRFSLFYLHRLVRETLFERLSLIDLLGLKEAKLPTIRGKLQLCFGF